MLDLKDSAVQALDGADIELYPYLPYLLQDLWEIGSSARNTIDILVKNHVPEQVKQLHILDLGCGKGAISIPIAKELNATVFGIDAFPEFIEEARLKSKIWRVANQCKFVAGDIRLEVNKQSGFNLILLASIGPIFGNVEQTLATIQNCLVPHGFISLDEAFIPENSETDLQMYLREGEFYRQITNSNFRIIDQKFASHEEMEESDTDIFTNIEMRARELMVQYPSQKHLFDAYLDAQLKENDVLENVVKNVSLLLQRNN
ncbi:class I SAM-dependent methyltransferase [candidate division KSB1 bacterium]|nr:class I SAM-dependent methyltransferase [candidate division KSB1 bacterium]